MSLIRIKRDNALVDSLREYKVVVDGKTIGTIDQTEIKDFNIQKGDHKL